MIRNLLIVRSVNALDTPRPNVLNRLGQSRYGCRRNQVRQESKKILPREEKRGDE